MSAAAATPQTPLAEAVERFAEGEPVLVAGREEHGAAVALSATGVTAARLAAVHELSGDMVVLGLDATVAERLGVSALGGRTRDAEGLSLASPIDARDCRDGGWSLADRVHTIRVAADPAAEPADLTVPGHVHAGLIDGASLTAPTAALELAHAASHPGAVLLRPLTDRAGRPVSLAQAARERRLAGLPIARVEQLWWSGGAAERGTQTAACRLPTRLGDFEVSAAVTSRRGETIVTLVHGDPGAAPNPLTSTHTACLLGDTFGSRLCDCRERLERACARIHAEGAGVLIYVKPAGGQLFACPRSGRGA
jgi:3,4-dihydroxy 2-butanone 4-phosphate synthase / GTP cyclohydrolase II